MSIKKILFGAVNLVALSVLVACGNGGNEELENIKLGLVGEENAEWEYVSEQLVDEGIDLELVFFNDYVTPNTALANGDIDINAFQTVIFLESYNDDFGEDLTPIAQTTLNPLGIYSESVTSVDDIPEGGSITIPNDPSNEGRALLLLEYAGLIEVDDEAGLHGVIDDITDNPLDLEITAVDANQTARTIHDVDATIINVGMATDAGYSPADDAILLESTDGDTEPYINAIVARPDETDREVFQTIIEAYQTDEVKELIAERTNNASIPVW